MRARRVSLCLLFIILYIALAGHDPAGECGAEKAALRCWHCGELFLVPADSTSPKCPSCGTPCKREADKRNLTIHCLEGGSSCSFILQCPDRRTVVFASSQEGSKVGIADYLKGMELKEVDLLIGADDSEGSIRAVLDIMKRFTVRKFFDSGFKNEQELYTNFLRELKTSGTEYQVVRAMENFSLGDVRFCLMRPSSFNAAAEKRSALLLGVVHDRNSFLLSRGLQGIGYSLRSLLSPGGMDTQGFYLQAVSGSLETLASPAKGRGVVVVESDGKEMGMKSLRRISLSSRPVFSAGGSTGPAGVSGGLESKKGKININTAGASELKKLTGIGVKKSQRIIEYREKHGAFRTISDIKKVSGIGEKTFQSNKNSICVK